MQKQRKRTAPARSYRHPADLIRLVVGLLALGATGLAARSATVGGLERDLFRLVNHLPDAATLPLLVLMQLGAVAAGPAIAFVALLARRVRLAALLLAGGLSAFLVADVIKTLVGRGRPASLLQEVILRAPPSLGLGFPSGHVATAAALATVAAPWLSRRARRLSWVVVVLVAVARIHVGAHLPLDVVGGAALGWVIGSALNLIVGAPGGNPTGEGVVRSLVRMGLPVAAARPVRADARASFPFLAETEDGDEVFVKVVRSEQRDADLLWKAWRFLVFRGFEDEAPYVSPKQQVEHEAYLGLLAQRAGARVPDVVMSGSGEDGSGILVFEAVRGRVLDKIEPRGLGDPVLKQAWEQVALLHRARIAHRDLRAENVMVDEGGHVLLVDLGFGEAGASERRLALDVAELLASTAVLVGPQRAVGSAREVLRPAELAAAAPFLQPLALTRVTRGKIRRNKGMLADLRGAVAETTGEALPHPEPIARFTVRGLIGLVGGAFAVHVLLPQVTELGEIAATIRSARWEWLLVGLLASAGRYPMAALAQIGAVEARLALARTTAVQVASSYANRAAPAGIGGIALKERYLERSGLDRAAAISAVTLTQFAGFLVHVTALTATAAIARRSIFGSLRLPRGWPLLVALGVATAAGGVLLWSPKRRSRVLATLARQVRGLRRIVRAPLRLAAILGGSAGVTAGYALALAASLHAFGAGAPLLHVFTIYLAASAVGAASPTPGGLGVVEAALIAGLGAVGIASGPAVAGVLAYRLLTFWLPILPGLLSFRYLSRKQVV